MSYITIKNLTKRIGENTVLNSIDLEINKGEAVGFVGKNGSGKTMLFRAVCGLIHPSEGAVIYEGKTIGRDINFLPHTGLLIENVGLWEHLTAFENLNLLNQLSEHQADASEIKELISKFGLDPDSPKPFKKFSLGMKQRLCLAQAFMGNPEILILDEPTNALDKAGVQEIEHYILEAKQKGCTILMASHDEKCIENICGRIFYLFEGRLSTEEL